MDFTYTQVVGTQHRAPNDFTDDLEPFLAVTSDRPEFNVQCLDERKVSMVIRVSKVFVL